MNSQLSDFAARLRDLIQSHRFASGSQPLDAAFESLALELFALQFRHNPVYQKICTARNLTPANVTCWTAIPAVPAAAFKELDLTSLAPAERTAVFHSSGTTEQKSSRHFHSPESLAVYESSLWQWFAPHFGTAGPFLFLTPPPAQARRSSLIHMFETVRQRLNLPGSAFLGSLASDGAWNLDFTGILRQLNTAVQTGQPVTLLGTAFSFVHLLDHLAENNLRFTLPAGSRVMETGGYKNRSRTMPKKELHALITDRLGLARAGIICEYGMSELSSQAYDSVADHPPSSILHPRLFRFPPWARVRFISPETGAEVAEGETGLIRIHDLANVFSVAALQTEDLGVRRAKGFELLGRATAAEPRGCSLLSA